MECKSIPKGNDNLKELYASRKERRKFKNKYEALKPNDRTLEQEIKYELATQEYAIKLSLEPSMDELNSLASEVKKGTELGTILMALKT